MTSKSIPTLKGSIITVNVHCPLTGENEIYCTMINRSWSESINNTSIVDRLLSGENEIILYCYDESHRGLSCIRGNEIYCTMSNRSLSELINNRPTSIVD